MASPATVEEFVDLVHKSGVADDKRVDAYIAKLRAAGTLPKEPSKLAGLLVREGYLTHFQAEHIAQGKWRRFNIGKYKVLEKLGSGGMGQVFLCEHKLMRCKRAIKILPTAKAQDEAALSRFYREARAVAAIDHPNIVHAYDIDQDENLHFLVMEYVDGSSLQDIVKKSGPLSVLRACHYIHQSAIGLDHAQRAGLVHRDIKPGNILVARDGTVKILDMGLARFFNDDDDILTRKFDENVLGTADYLAPEQALDSHTVDNRADIYSLGATFYYLLTSKTPFGEGTVAQKLFWHQSRLPKSVREMRPDVPAPVEAIIAKMMAKDPAQRYQTPAELADALAPLTEAPIDAPPEVEMPLLSPAATGRTGEGSHHDVAEPTAISKPETPRALQHMSAAGAGKSARPAPSPVSAATAPPLAPTPHVSNGVKAGPPVIAPPPAQPMAPSAVTMEPALAHAPAPAIETEPEEDFGWQGLAGETSELTAGADDTTPTKDKPHPGRPVAAGADKAAARNKQIVLLVVALMGFAGCLGALVSGAFVTYSYWADSGEGQAKSATVLTVSPQEVGKRQGVYKTITAALRIAPKDAIIELAEDIEENVSWPINAAGTTEVTIQPAAGKEVIWRSKAKDGAPLLKLTNATFFKLKGPGLILDGALGNKVKGKGKDKGKTRVKDLISIVGSSQGLTVENVQVRNFERSGVCVVSAAGDKQNPIRIDGLTALTPPAEAEGAVLYIYAHPNFRIKQVDCIVAEHLQAPGVPAKQLVHADNADLGDKLVHIPALNRN